MFLAASVLILQNICCNVCKIKGLINATTCWQPLGVTYLQHTCCVKGGGGQIFFKNYFVRKLLLFAIIYQENTTVCLLQPKTLGRNYLCMNNRYIIFIRFIILKSPAHHFCKNMYLNYTIPKNNKQLSL